MMVCIAILLRAMFDEVVYEIIIETACGIDVKFQSYLLLGIDPLQLGI